MLVHRVNKHLIATTKTGELHHCMHYELNKCQFREACTPSIVCLRHRNGLIFIDSASIAHEMYVYAARLALKL